MSLLHAATRARRARLMERHPDGLILVRAAGAQGVNPNFYYLTGLTEPAGALVLAASGVRIQTGRESPGEGYISGRSVQQVLLLPRSDPAAAVWGEDVRAAVDRTDPVDVGVDAVLPVSGLRDRLSAWLRHAQRLYVVGAGQPSLIGGATDELVADVRGRFLNVEVRDATSTVANMRSVKDALELAALERAAAITADGFARVAAALHPGVTEHALEAQLACAYREAGADHAFGPIVGSGVNALCLHYRDNAATVSDGDLVLVDSGATFDGYAADVTRTYPANGLFSPRQRELYQIVLDAQAATIAAIRPGCRLTELHAIAWQALEAHGHGTAFVHGIGHHLGLETHDAGDTHAALEEGAVITVEPGIYLTDEGIGVRIEDDVLVTADGSRVLTAAIPREIDQIEAQMLRRPDE